MDIRRTKFWPKTKEANETLFSENEEQTTSSNNGQNCCHGHAFFPPYQYPLFCELVFPLHDPWWVFAGMMNSRENLGDGFCWICVVFVVFWESNYCFGRVGNLGKMGQGTSIITSSSLKHHGCCCSTSFLTSSKLVGVSIPAHLLGKNPYPSFSEAPISCSGVMDVRKLLHSLQRRK